MSALLYPIVLTLLLLSTSAATPAVTSDAMLQRQLIAQIQARLDAIAVGDKTPWERDLDPQALIVDEEGNVSGKAAYLASLKPLPKGSSGTLRVTQPQFRRIGDIAVVTFVADEHERIYNAHFAAHFAFTDTYHRVGNRWLLVSEQDERLQMDPPTTTLSDVQKRLYVGRYRMVGGPYVFAVHLAGGQLMGGREGSTPLPLEAIADQPNTFFQPHRPATFIFVPRANGIPVKLIDRRYYNRDLVYRRI